MSIPAKILLVSLSNIGDAVMTLPVLDRLKTAYPGASITVISGPRPQELFRAAAGVSRVIVYDKHCSLRRKIAFIRSLRRERFDLVVDLRKSIFGMFAGGRLVLRPVSSAGKHSVQRHLARLGRQAGAGASTAGSIRPAESDLRAVSALLAGLAPAAGPLIVCSPGARSQTKRWPQERWEELIVRICSRMKAQVVLVGDNDDAALNRQIAQAVEKQLPGAAVADLSGRTSLMQLACLLQRCAALITNDSANMHLASYLDRPVVAVFGPTDDALYGPWSSRSRLVMRQLFCRPCRQAQCRFATLECLRLVKSEDVFRALQDVLAHVPSAPCAPGPDCKRVLVMRTDKIGDVVLSLPVLGALRRRFPAAFIALMVRPYTRALVSNDPCADRVLLYDKQGIGRSLWRTLAFAGQLRRLRFDCCLVLNPSVRNHIIAFLAGIPRRIGYHSKAGFLLTERLPNTKHRGEKHEVDYTLDLLSPLGIAVQGLRPQIVPDPGMTSWAQDYLAGLGLGGGTPFCMINPGSADPSRVWPAERYAAVADHLVRVRRLPVVITSGKPDAAVARQVLERMAEPAVDLIDKTDLAQQAALISRCRLFISPDTGPMHIASAFNVPVIALFGRKDRGVGPQRWGPLSDTSRVIQKDVGCSQCLAHACRKGFLCLQAIAVQDVLAVVDAILLDK